MRDQYAIITNRKNLFQLGGDSWTLTVDVSGMLPIAANTVHLAVGEEKGCPGINPVPTAEVSASEQVHRRCCIAELATSLRCEGITDRAAQSAIINRGILVE